MLFRYLNHQKVINQKTNNYDNTNKNYRSYFIEFNPGIM